MGLIDIFIIIGVAAGLFFAFRFIRRNKGGCGGCHGCSGDCGSCGYREETKQRHGKR